MTKAEFVAEAATRFDISKRQAGDAIAYVLDRAFEITAKDGSFIFGKHKFKLKDYQARKGSNPKTGEPIDIPACQKVVYSRKVDAEDLKRL